MCGFARGKHGYMEFGAAKLTCLVVCFEMETNKTAILYKVA